MICARSELLFFELGGFCGWGTKFCAERGDFSRGWIFTVRRENLCSGGNHED